MVQNVEDAASNRGPPFDYVLLCVKALPDVYNLADIIQSVVTPQHTCILVNTTNTLGVEKQLEQRFPTNVVLSLVSGASLTQLASSEFEHSGSTDVWVGPANLDSKIPQSIQRDMSEALAMTLSTGHVDCRVSDNIRQQQFERMIGYVVRNTTDVYNTDRNSPIAFHPTSVLFETSNLAALLLKPGVRELVMAVIEEMVQLASASRCTMPANFKETVIENMTQSGQDVSTMYQDFAARRPMEIETYLGAPCQLAQQNGIAVPRIETLYTILRHINATNKDRPLNPVPESQQAGPVPNGLPPPPQGRPMNGPSRPMQTRSGPNGMPPPVARRGPPPVNGYRGPPANGHPLRGPGPLNRKPSFNDEGLAEDFSHVVLYGDIPDGDVAAAYNTGANGSATNLRERELAMREKELRVREHELAIRHRGPPRRHSHNRHQAFDDDDDDDDYFDPMDARPVGPPIDPDNFDMMSVTSRRTNKKATSQNQLRQNMFQGGGGAPMRPGSFNKPGRHRASAQLMSDMPVLGSNILDNPMMGFASNRYGNVDRKEMADESRANSLTASRLHDMGGPHGPYPPPSRRTSRSPGNPLGPTNGPVGRPSGRPSPPHEVYGPGRNGRPSPPGQMPAPAPRYPPGQGNVVHPRAIEQQVGVSKPFPPKPTKSLTGSASASAGSGDGSSANTESDPSAHSSTSSFAPRAMTGVRQMS